MTAEEITQLQETLNSAAAAATEQILKQLATAGVVTEPAPAPEPAPEPEPAPNPEPEPAPDEGVSESMKKYLEDKEKGGLGGRNPYGKIAMY